jgi:hypothetical protein
MNNVLRMDSNNRKKHGISADARACKRPRITNKRCNHVCEVTLDRLFLERQEWVAMVKSLQEQIDVLSDWRGERGLGAAAVPAVASSSNTATGGRHDSEIQYPSMPSDHPLYSFAMECLKQTNWASRAKCGAVRRRYVEWWKKQDDCRQKKMNHLCFSLEMKKYWQRKGCQTRSYYVGIELARNIEEENEEMEDGLSAEGVVSGAILAAIALVPVTPGPTVAAQE